MKKLLLLFCALLCLGGSRAWAEKYYRTNGRVTSLSTGTKYIIYNTTYTGYDKRFYLYGDGTAFSVKKPTVVGTTTNIVTDNKYIWTLEESATPGEYYLKNENSGKYFDGSTSTLGDTPKSMVFTRWDKMEAGNRGGDAQSEAADGTYRSVGSFNDATDVWGIQISGGNFFNGNDGELVTWSNGHPYAIYAVVEIDGTAITYGADQGTCFNTSQRIVTSGWAGTWISTADPSVLIKSTTNNISPETSQNGKLHANNITYTVSVGSGYTIDSYRIIGRSGDATNVNIKVGDDVKCTFTNSKDADVLVTVNASSATFTLTGGSSKFLVPSSFVFYVKGSATGDNIQAISQLSNSKCYYIKSADPNEYAYRQDFCINNSNDGVSATINDNTSSNRETANKKQFAIISYEGNYFLYSVSEGKFVSNSSESFAAGDTPVLTTNPQHPIVISKGVFTDAWMIRYKSDNNNNYINISSKLVKLIAASSSDYGTYLRLVVADDFDATTALAALNTEAEYTYKVYHGSPLTYSGYSASTVQEKGATPSIPALLSRPYCTYSYYSDAACETPMATLPSSAATVYVKYTFAPSFTVSADYASATWYYLKLSGRYVYYDTSTVPYPLVVDKTNANIQYSPYALWAFAGNPYDGIVVYNKAAGSAKYLDSRDSQPIMGTTFDSNVKWTITRQDDSKFSLKVGSKCLNNNGGGNPGILSYWTNAGAPLNSGSALPVEAVSFKELAVADVTNYALTHAVGQYFGVDETEVNSTVSYIKGYAGDFTEKMYNDVISGLSELEINYPSTGYYLIHHVESSYYLGTDGLWALLQPTVAPSNIATLTKGEGNNYNIAVQGKYVNPVAKGYFFNLSDSPSSFSGKITDGKIELWYSDSYCILAQSYENYGRSMGWDSYGNSTKWTVEDAEGASFTVPLTNVGDYSYATLYLPFGATITGAKAYILTVSGEWAIPHEISEVPANTGVLLRAEGDVDEVTVTVKSAATADTEGNMLAGTNIDITADRSAGEYILGNDATDGLGFYQRKSGRKIGANKAYLQLDADLAASVKGLLLNFDEETGISTVQGSGLMVNGSEIFNLAGQRMSRVKKGVNIVNGKKVLVK